MDTGVAIALIVAGVVISGIVFFVVGMLYRKKVAEKEIGGAETVADAELERRVTDFLDETRGCHLVHPPINPFVDDLPGEAKPEEKGRLDRLRLLGEEVTLLLAGRKNEFDGPEDPPR